MNLLKMPIIHPETRVKFFWDMVISLAVLVTIFLTPLSLVLGNSFDTKYRWYDIVINLLFIIDIFLNFNTAYYSDSILITDRPTIRKQYLKGWFVIDLLSALPFFLLGSSLFVSLDRFLRFFRLLRLLRLLKIFTLYRTLNKIFENKVNSNFVRLILMAMWLSVIAHFISCGFIAIIGFTESLSPMIQYLRALYWTTTTLATIGYGDITPDKNNPVQLIFTITTQVTGVGMYGFVIGNISSVIANLNISKTLYIEKIEKINTFLNYKKISTATIKKVNQYYEYLWESRKGHDEHTILTGLPVNIRLNIAQELHSELIGKVPFFKEASPSFLKEVILHLQPLVFTPGDTLVENGDIGQEMFFINKGSVSVLAKNGEVVATLGEGSYFGESALLFSSPRNATIIAADFCDIYSLPKSSFERVLAKYPDFELKIVAIAKDRKKEIENSSKIS